MTFNSALLTVARESRGLTRAALAEACEITAGYVSKIEDSFALPSDSVVESFGRELGYPVAFFTQVAPAIGIDSPCLYHRKRKTMPLRDLRRLEALMHVTRLQVRGVLDEVELLSPYSMHTLDPDEHGSPERVAQMLRAAWGLSRGPIRNLTQILEAAGAVVVLADFQQHKLDGMACWEKTGPPLFYLNRERPTDILRFTLAHELGHLTMHRFPSTNLETEADSFAAEFLMPKSEIRSQLKDLQFSKLGRLKGYWGVSMRNLVTRASKLGAITPSRARSLYVQLSQRGFITEEPFALPAEEPTLLPQAIRVHAEDHGYSVDEIAEAMLITRDDLLNRFGECVPFGAKITRLTSV